MGFLNDFGVGFSKGLQKRIDLKDEQDAKVKAEIQTLDYKSMLEERKAERAAKLLAEQRKNYGSNPEMAPMNGNIEPTEGLPSVGVPASTVSQPTNDFMGQFTQNRKVAKDAYQAGDTDYAKGLDAEADVIKAQLDQDKYARTVKREDRQTAREEVKSIEGIVPAKAIIEEDTAILAKNEANSGLYNKYFGEPKDINYANPIDKDSSDAAIKVKQSVKQAATIASVLTSATADPNTGISSESSETLKGDAVDLVKYKNILADETKVDQHQVVRDSMAEILDKYPEASAYIFKTLKLQDIVKPTQETPTEPVTLSSDKPNSNVSNTKPAITKAEYQALPSGARYLHPDGTYKVKK